MTTAKLKAHIASVERVPGRPEAWLDLELKDGQRSHLRLTLLSAPDGIESAQGDEVVLAEKFILKWHHGLGKFIRWAHRINYCSIRLCKPE